MTSFTGNGVDFYRWAVIRSTLKLELKTRDLGMRSAHLKRAWPSLLAELGLPYRRMTKKALEDVIVEADKKFEQAQANLKPGDVEP